MHHFKKSGRRIARIFGVAACVSAAVLVFLGYEGTGIDGRSYEELIRTGGLLTATLLYFWALWDASLRPKEEFEDAPLTKGWWIWILLLLPWASLPPYLFMVWLRLEDAED